MNNTLLPSSASTLEKRIATITLAELPVDIRTLYDPLTCPVAFLPFLAWQFSVDRWDQDWSETIKRKVILDAYNTHRKKGTIYAIKKAVAPFGFVIEIIEWFQNDGVPGTFSIYIGILEQGITEEDYLEMERIINDARCYSRKITELRIILVTKGAVFYGAKTHDGEIVDVYPFTQEDASTQSQTQYAAVIYDVDRVTINPIIATQVTTQSKSQISSVIYDLNIVSINPMLSIDLTTQAQTQHAIIVFDIDCVSIHPTIHLNKE